MLNGAGVKVVATLLLPIRVWAFNNRMTCLGTDYCSDSRRYSSRHGVMVFAARGINRRRAANSQQRFGLVSTVVTQVIRDSLPSTAHRGVLTSSRGLESSGGTLHYQADRRGNTVQVYSLRIQRQDTRFRRP
jgi:hypothetical protein